MNLLEAFDELNKCYEDLNDNAKAAQKELINIKSQLDSKIQKLLASINNEPIEIVTQKGNKAKKETLTLNINLNDVIKADPDVFIKVGTEFIAPYDPNLKYTENEALNTLAEEIRTLFDKYHQAEFAVKHNTGLAKADSEKTFQKNVQISDDVRAKKKAEMAKERAEEHTREKAALSKTEWDALTDEEKAAVEKEAAEKAAASFAEKYANIKLSAEELKDLAYTMGWLAGHATNVRASAPYNLVDGLKARLSENASGESTNLEDNLYEVTYDACLKARARNTIPQYAISFMIKLNKRVIDKQDGFVAPMIEQADGYHKDELVLYNTRLIWKLVEDYGLKFGRKQDVDYMKSMWTDPKDLEKFELGFNAIH